MHPKSPFTLKAVYQFLIGLCLFVFASSVLAYTFPGNLPSGCSGSGSAYTCGSLTISEHYFFTGSGDVTVTVNGSLTINNYTIGQWNDNANVTFVVNGNVTINSPTIYANINAGSNNITYNGPASTSGNLITTTGNISTRGAVYGNITTTSGDIWIADNNTSQIWGEITIKDYANSISTISIGNDAVVNGAIYNLSTSSTANVRVLIGERATVNGSIIAQGRDHTEVDIDDDAVINGDVTAFGDDSSNVKLGNRARINGSVKSTSVDNDDGDVDLNSGSIVTGNITAFGDIDNEGQINGCAHSTYTAGGDIRLRSGSSNSGGSCCGSSRTSCNSSCVDNDSSFATTLCQPAEAIVVNAYGSASNGVWPIMELWVNEVKVDSVVVNSGSAQNYTFYVNLPATAGFKLDLVFPNDAWNPPEDRNLFINSINFKSKTILSTDPSVTRDFGYDASTYFDGVSTQGPGAEMYSNGAMRFNTSELVAYYALDETSWSGTLNETKDTAGFTGGPFDGQAGGSPLASPSDTNPAISGNTGTCGYADFSGSTSGGSTITLDNLPVSTDSGDKTSVSFWMYWDGTQYVQPIGWQTYNLYFDSSRFGFNTAGNDIWGISSSGLANGWHHVVAVFANADVQNSVMYIDGVKQTLTQFGSIYDSNITVDTTLYLSGWGLNTSWRFPGGRIDEVKVYNGEVTQAQVTADYNAVHSCPGYVVNTPASGFNCVATGTAGNTGHLYTQLVGNAFNIDVVALKTDGSVETTFAAASNQNVTVELVNGAGSTSCTSRAVLSPTVSQTVTFSASDTGRKSIPVTVNKAYRDLRCRVTDTNQTPTVVGCSSDNFAIRPVEFVISSNANADTGGNSASSVPVFKAEGDAFTLTVDSVAGYDGTPSINQTRYNVRNNMVTTGTLTGNFSAANPVNGQATGANFKYSEVGYFKFMRAGVYDDTFTAVDSANGDCVGTLNPSGGLYPCNIFNESSTNYVGRFIPSSFNVDDGSVTTAGECSTGNFTYYGQDGLNTTFIIRAVNASGSRTQNYHGDFAKLNINTWTNTAATTGLRFLASNLPTGVSLLASGSAPTGSWNQGQATVTAKHQFSRPTTPVGEVNIQLKADPLDSDNVPVINNTPENVSVAANGLLRYGRLKATNAYGSARLPLTMQTFAQYWDATTGTYRNNTDDDCANIALGDITLSNYTNTLSGNTTLSIGSVNNGNIHLTFSKPTNNASGSVDLSFDLTTTPWLSTSPVTNARATFGLRKSPFIYMRENF